MFIKMRKANLIRQFHNIFLLILFIFFFATNFLPLFLSEINSTIFFQFKRFQSKEFRVELKDVNISYYYYGYGPNYCNGSNVLIATLSRPNSFRLRAAVRNSWGKEARQKYTHKFFVGGVRNEIQRRFLKYEARKFGDIVFTNLIDSYLNLTLKMSGLFQWQQFYCPKVDYFLRADEDTVLDVSRFEYWLEKEINGISKQYNNTVIFGHLNENFPIIRDSEKRWYIPYEAYNITKYNHTYPPYMNGPSFLLTSKSIKLILTEAKNHKFITVDDALFTGIVAEAAGIPKINLEKHFAFGNPLNQWEHECDENGKPFLFSIYDDSLKVKKRIGGYDEALKNLKELKCPNSTNFVFVKKLFIS